MSTATIDGITDFPNSSIPIIEGQPTCETIKQAEKLLIEHASSIKTTLGGGNHVFLGLILKPENYVILTGYTFEPHVNLVALPVTSPNSKQHQILNTNDIHKEMLHLSREQTFVCKALKIN